MNPSGPVSLPSFTTPHKDSFAVTPDGRILPPEQFDPNSWQVLVEADE